MVTFIKLTFRSSISSHDRISNNFTFINMIISIWKRDLKPGLHAAQNTSLLLVSEILDWFAVAAVTTVAELKIPTPQLVGKLEVEIILNSDKSNLKH